MNERMRISFVCPRNNVSLFSLVGSSSQRCTDLVLFSHHHFEKNGIKLLDLLRMFVGLWPCDAQRGIDLTYESPSKFPIISILEHNFVNNIPHGNSMPCIYSPRPWTPALLLHFAIYVAKKGITMYQQSLLTSQNNT